MLKKRDGDNKILDVNASMQGNLTFSDPVNLRINGKFEGNLTTKGLLIIGEQADVKANIVGENVTIAGRVKGKIKTTMAVSLIATAEVYGDIEAPKIAIENGAVFNGHCKMPHDKMSLSELSEYLSIEEDKIMEWVDKGRIPVRKEEEQLFFDRKEVESWIGQNV